MDGRQLRSRFIPDLGDADDQSSRQGSRRSGAGEGFRTGASHRSLPAFQATEDDVHRDVHQLRAELAEELARTRQLRAEMEATRHAEEVALEAARLQRRAQEAAEEATRLRRHAEEVVSRRLVETALSEDGSRLREPLVRMGHEVRRSSHVSEPSLASLGRGEPLPGLVPPPIDRRLTDWIVDQRRLSASYEAHPSPRPEPVRPAPTHMPRQLSNSAPIPLPRRSPVLDAPAPQSLQHTHPHPQCCGHAAPTGFEAYLVRKTAGKDLPKFSGDPQEWLQFITSFRRSTEVCKFSDDENLIRLQKSLTGRARDTVGALLCMPGTVKDIIKALELQFGNPQVIVKSLLQKFRKFPTITDDKLHLLIEFYNKVNNLVISMEVVDCAEYLLTPQILDDLVEKLTPNLKLMWGRYSVASSCIKRVSLTHFRDFLYEQAQAIAITGVAFPKERRDEKVNVVTANPNRHSERDKTLCIFCNETTHSIGNCGKFKAASLTVRRDYVKNQNLCFLCLRTGHIVVDCTWRKRCGVGTCTRRHHALLHDEQAPAGQRTAITAGAVRRDATSAVVQGADRRPRFSVRGDASRALLKILNVRVHGPKGEMTIQALLDDGATATLIDQQVADTIGAQGPLDPLCVRWIDASTCKEEKSQSISLSISGVSKGCKRFKLNGVRTITGLSLAAQDISEDDLVTEWPKLQEYADLLASKGPPRMIIGQDNWALIHANECYRSRWNGIALEKTLLGWVLHGNVRGEDRSNSTIHVCQVEKSDEGLHELVKQYFSLDAVGFRDPVIQMSEDERQAISLLNSTSVCRDGTWEVGLLWKNDLPLVDSKPAALKRLVCLERKLDKDPDFARQYIDKIEDYLVKGYARKLSPEKACEIGPKTWYLPHLAVFNPNKPGKIRVVFDASAKAQGMSLNDNLLKGPDLYSSIPQILMRFRKGTIAFGGDIKEMFLRIRIREADQNAQRFLWRGMERSSEVCTYVMQVMLFGAVSSPFQAQEVKNRNALRFQDEYPEAVRAITESHYMDDYLDSSDTVEGAVKMIQTVTKIHKAGDFVMCNWVSNSEDVLERVKEHVEVKHHDLFTTSIPAEKVLGMKWEMKIDCFVFKLNRSKVSDDVLKGIRNPTKREILRIVMSIFDPLGFLGYFTIRAKIILQDIWRKKLGWDEPIDQNSGAKFLEWVSDLEKIEGLQIPRCYTPLLPSAQSLELHVFCDASDRAYSAVVYLRAEYGDREAEVSFVSAKSKVAPLKQQSIPRMELQAALMGAKLAEYVHAGLGLPIKGTVYWTDSGTVLSWITNHERRYKMFVAHRLGLILELTKPEQWRWTPGKYNAADCATKEGRGVENLWLGGPEFLKLKEPEWPKRVYGNDSGDPLSLELINLIVLELPETPPPSLDVLVPDIARFSNWLRLIRSTAWAVKFLWSFRRFREIAPPDSGGGLAREHLIEAERLWWKVEQKRSFREELTLLNQNKGLPKSSKLFRLTPFLDEEGIIRVSGRIGEALGVSTETKNPVILHSSSGYVSLLISHFHRKFAHQGQELVMNELRQKYWIIGLRRAVRSCWSRCVLCAEWRANHFSQRMGPLPPARLKAHSPPFSSSGVDYFGPLWITNRRRKEKRYGVIFTCLTTRAVHLELAADLCTDATILAIRRMASRRGCPRELWSDNATNFKGADRVIKGLLKSIDQAKIKEELLGLDIVWHFLPPQAPHMGGAWERLIRSIKTALRVTLKDRAPREDILYTTLLETEHILNTRPLTRVSDDPADEEALTPNHFLIGGSSGSRLWWSDSAKPLTKHWQEAQQLAARFWKRWLREYLPGLVRSSRWFAESPSAQVGQLVYLPATEGGHWSRGRITAVHPGKDGRVRVVDVKTPSGLVRRAVTSLVPLPVEPHSPQGLEDVPD